MLKIILTTLQDIQDYVSTVSLIFGTRCMG